MIQVEDGDDLILTRIRRAERYQLPVEVSPEFLRRIMRERQRLCECLAMRAGDVDGWSQIDAGIDWTRKR